MQVVRIRNPDKNRYGGELKLDEEVDDCYGYHVNTFLIPGSYLMFVKFPEGFR
jgi:hypothetical protein